MSGISPIREGRTIAALLLRVEKASIFRPDPSSGLIHGVD
ncbi:hypothetical protein ACPOL_4072 [Acidisarcina polymorpha]|uniref:Uncharacterized protein n=1 Tax=Acidisarcina polymorpha TaxID=2211140 RepID=A0A2Z5G2S3_9BACT|nr:hypothetical protein ACPOL_4072 [Acidisarcina polymorpha]